MKRKIIQISVTGVEDNFHTQCSIVTVALCNDGTVWHLYNMHDGWFKQPTIPQNDEEKESKRQYIAVSL